MAFLQTFVVPFISVSWKFILICALQVRKWVIPYNAGLFTPNDVQSMMDEAAYLKKERPNLDISDDTEFDTVKYEWKQLCWCG